MPTSTNPLNISIKNGVTIGLNQIMLHSSASSALAKGIKRYALQTSLLAIEAFRTTKRGDVFDPPVSVTDEIRFMNEMFGIAA